MKNLKTKYNVLAQCKPESSALSVAPNAIYKTLVVIVLNGIVIDNSTLCSN
jgi:hypothetical protein